MTYVLDNFLFTFSCTIFEHKNLWFLSLQYVVVPTRRSTAEAFQILISHAFGDAGSPYLVGVVSILEYFNVVIERNLLFFNFPLQISEAIKASLRMTKSAVNAYSPDLTSLSQLAENATTTMPLFEEEDSIEMKFKALQYSLFTTSFVEILGGVFFLITASYILKDKHNAERQVAGNLDTLILVYSNIISYN